MKFTQQRLGINVKFHEESTDKDLSSGIHPRDTTSEFGQQIVPGSGMLLKIHVYYLYGHMKLTMFNKILPFTMFFLSRFDIHSVWMQYRMHCNIIHRISFTRVIQSSIGINEEILKVYGQSL